MTNAMVGLATVTVTAVGNADVTLGWDGNGANERLRIEQQVLAANA